MGAEIERKGDGGLRKRKRSERDGGLRNREKGERDGGLRKREGERDRG